jgi:hypothetical protein
VLNNCQFENICVTEGAVHRISVLKTSCSLKDSFTLLLLLLYL